MVEAAEVVEERTAWHKYFAGLAAGTSPSPILHDLCAYVVQKMLALELNHGGMEDVELNT